MSNWLDDIINKAREEGQFDNLPGEGKPLNLSRNPNEDPALQLANHILRENKFSWPWMEERKEIEDILEQALAELAAAHRSGDPFLWTRAADAFRQKAADLNRAITAYNLKAPSPAFQRLPIDAEAEIERMTRP